MAKVLWKRINYSGQIDSLPIQDGAIIVTKDGKIYVDFDTERVPVGGSPDDEMSDISTNPIENKVVKKYIDDLINNSTSNYIKLGKILICWGKTDTFNIPTGSGVTRDIQLPKEFKDTNYVVTCSITDGGGFWANGVEFRGAPLTTGSIRLIAGNYLSGGVAQNIRGAYICIGECEE